jgi:transposase
VCHASYSTIRKYVRDVLQIQVSRGYLAKVIAEVTAALEQPYEELLKKLPDEAFVNVDETGHPDQGADLWTWCFRAELFTLYHVDPYRKSDVLIEILGEEFQGVMGCDYFSAYQRYMRLFDIRVQFCLAHLIRDVKFLTTLPDKRDRAYGERLREALRGLFQVIHKRERLGERSFLKALRQARDQVLEAGMNRVPAGKHCQNIAKRFREHGEAYFTFITTPGVEPTNNLAEQAIRFVVIDRLITQGTRSKTGQRWCERIWTVIATCAQQGKSVYAFLGACITASLHGTATPSLVS